MSFGGDGNGLYIASSDKVIKGVREMATELGVHGAKEEDFCLFHTRKASCGGVVDSLCHPFLVDGDSGKYAVMHNGHWGPWRQYDHKDERSDTETMANLVAKHGIDVLLSDAAKDSGVWIVYDRDINRCYALRRSGSFYLQRLQSVDITDPPTFFHASEPMRLFRNWRRGCGLIKPDLVYELRPTGKAKEKRGWKSVEPERVKRTSYTSYNSYDDYWHGSGGGYFNDPDLHPHRHSANPRKMVEDYVNLWAYGYDNENFRCYCRSDTVCWRCAEHEKKFGQLPLYEHDRPWVESLSQMDLVICNLPQNYIMPAPPKWVQEELEAREKDAQRAVVFSKAGDDWDDRDDKVPCPDDDEDIIIGEALERALQRAEENERRKTAERRAAEAWGMRAAEGEHNQKTIQIYAGMYAFLRALTFGWLWPSLGEPTKGPVTEMTGQTESEETALATVGSDFLDHPGSSTYPFAGRWRCLTFGCDNWTDDEHCAECVAEYGSKDDEIWELDECEMCGETFYFRSPSPTPSRLCTVCRLEEQHEFMLEQMGLATD